MVTLHVVLKPRLHDTTGCQTRLTTVWQTAVSCVQPVVKPVVQPGLTTGWTNSGCSFNTVVKPFDNRFDNRLEFCLHDTASCQPVVSCKRGITDYPTRAAWPMGKCLTLPLPAGVDVNIASK